MDETACVIFRCDEGEAVKEYDLEVPLNISANELVIALNEAYRLGIDVDDITQCFLRCERPIMLLRGDKTLGEYGVRNGTIIHSLA